MNITFHTPPGGPNKLIINTGTQAEPVVFEYGPDDFEEYSRLYPDRAIRDFSIFEYVQPIEL